MMRLTVALLAVLLIGTPAIAADDFTVVNGVYSGTIRALTFGGTKIYQGVVINSGDAADRFMRVRADGSVDVNIISGGSGGGGGGTEYSEDSAHVSGDIGTMALCVRRDAATSTVNTDGDYSPCIVDGSGRLWVAAVQSGTWTVTSNIGTTGGLALDATLTAGSQKSIMRGAAKGATPAADATVSAVNADVNAVDVYLRGGVGGAGGVSQSDKSVFTEGTTSGTPAFGVFNDAISADPAEDQAAAIRITPKRAGHVNLRSQAGTEMGTASNPLRVEPAGTTNGLALDATLTGGTQKAIARGAAKGATAAGDATVTTAGANRNNLDVTIRDSAGNEVSVGGGTQYIQGTVATDTDVMTRLACERKDTLAIATGVADRDRSGCFVDANGALYVKVSNSATTGTGNVDASTPRVTIASDSLGQIAPSPITGVLRLPTLVTGSGDTVIVTGQANQAVKVYSMDLFCNGANNAILKSGTTNSPPTLWPVHNFAAQSGVLIPEVPSRTPWFVSRNTATATDNGLVLNLSAANPCAITITYTQS